MVKEDVRIDIYGQNFLPAKILSIMEGNLQNVINIGDSGRIGRYKGTAIPYGRASIVPPKNINNPIGWILNFIKDKIEFVRQNGGADIQLSVAYYYKGQCNCELGLEEISLLNELKIPFIFSVYEDDDLVEDFHPA